MKLLGILHDGYRMLLTRKYQTCKFDGISGEYDGSSTPYFAMRQLCIDTCGVIQDDWRYIGVLLPDTHVYACKMPERLDLRIRNTHTIDTKIIQLDHLISYDIQPDLEYVMPFAKYGKQIKEIFACSHD